MVRRTSAAWVATSKPATAAKPDVAGSKVVSTLIVVLLPAPLGPRRPKISPGATDRSMLSTATTVLKVRVRPRISTARGPAMADPTADDGADVLTDGASND